jgi:nucleotide sugar dehydrogenase
VACDLVVVGLGYVGLPLARAAVASGMSVRGYDSSPDVVAGLASGHSHVDDVVDVDVAAMRAAGFTATLDPAAIADAETVVVCVPTPLAEDRTPDLRPLVDACHTVATRISRGALLVVESTSFPGTTEELVRPIVEAAGHEIGGDVCLAYSPERVDPGNAAFGIANTPKIVSGCTPLCAKRCQAFYERFVDTVVLAAGTREAEMAKLLENTYRDVNIALVNALAMFCHEIDVDVWEVLRCAATKPFGFQAFRPGVGVGGHCIPVDPVYLLHKAETQGVALDLVRAARQVNNAMPEHIVRRVQALLNEAGLPVKGARVALLGVTYKRDVGDLREAPAIAVVRSLRRLGARVVYHDPHAREFSVDGVRLPRLDDAARGVAEVDIAVLLADHRRYDVDELARHARLLFDTTGRARGERVVLL